VEAWGAAWNAKWEIMGNMGLQKGDLPSTWRRWTFQGQGNLWQ